MNKRDELAKATNGGLDIFADLCPDWDPGKDQTVLASERGERRKSRSIYNDGGIYKHKDHGTGEGGDAIDLYMRIHGCDFPTAHLELTEKYCNGRTRPVRQHYPDKPAKEGEILEYGSKIDYFKEKYGIEELSPWCRPIKKWRTKRGKIVTARDGTAFAFESWDGSIKIYQPGQMTKAYWIKGGSGDQIFGQKPNKDDK